MIELIKRNWKKSIAIGALTILLIIVIVGKGQGDDGEIKHVVTRGDITDTLVLSGKVEPVDRVEMAFATSGAVERVYKQNGDTVRAGEKIVELDNSSLRASLADAMARLDIEKAEAEVSNAELDQAVLNAYAKLLSDDLVAYSKDPDVALDQSPVISGSYEGSREGEYKVDVEFSNNNSQRKIRYSGLESGTIDILDYKAVPLGNNGLFIKFDEGEAAIGDTWRVSIPNVEGDSYVANLSAYKAALASRDAAQSENVSDEISKARIKQAEAQVAGINADIEERILRAPFNGVVSKVDISRGEIASSGTIVATVISPDSYQVKVQVPEVDIVNMVPGLVANITLDAYGKEVIFPAKVFSVDQSETKVDGVTIYEAKVLFDQGDPRILSGMTANIEIKKAEALGALFVPASFVEEDATSKFVTVYRDEESVKTYITTGLRGSDGNIEIKDGISEGDTITAQFK